MAMQNYPFAAIVGHSKLKTAYLVNIVNPRIGGLLIMGAKGTGKSTLVRSVAGILPDLDVVSGCPFHCNPEAPATWCSTCRDRSDHPVSRVPMRIVNMPLSITEDRLIGSVRIEELLQDGRREIQVGILGEANRNILYIDEVNLLPDHIVDDILDAAASRRNQIEREGFSISHPADFVLVGTMNPEEGDLRPQILDRFPLSVTARSIVMPEMRVELVKRNLLFESDPDRLAAEFTRESEIIRDSILPARKLLSGTSMPDRMMLSISGACAELKVDGQRPDIIIVKAACTISALNGRDRVKEEDVLLSAVLALGHRTRDGGLLEPPSEEEVTDVFTRRLQKPGSGGAAPGPGAFKMSDISVDKSLDDFVQTRSSSGTPVKKKLSDPVAGPGPASTKIDSGEVVALPAGIALPHGPASAPEDTRGAQLRLNVPSVDYERIPLFHSSRHLLRRSRTLFFKFLKRFRSSSPSGSRRNPRRNRVTTTVSGRDVRAVSFHPGRHRLAVLPSILNALRQGRFDRQVRRLAIATRHFLGWERQEPESLTLIMVVDVSRSSLPFARFFTQVLNTLSDYFHRHNDRIGLISLQGTQARILNHPTRNGRVVIRNLLRLKMHGQTPLADGLVKALDMAKLEQNRKPGSKSIVILLSDCYPEPITHEYEDIQEEPVYVAARNAANLYRIRRVPLMVINPGFPPGRVAKLKPGQRLSMMITEAARGTLFRVPMIEDDFNRTSTMPSPEKSVERIVEFIERTFSGQQIPGTGDLSMG